MILIRVAQHPAPPAPTAPATLPLSARRRVVLLMATVLQGLVFAVSRNIMNYYSLLECVMSGLITVSTCGSTVSTNTSYIRNTK